MPRTARYAPGGYIYHVLNRGVGRQQLFFNDDDYLAFERIIVETLEKREMRILSYCLMPNHWHFVLWPENDGDLGRFMQRMTITHVTRWQRNYNIVGYGHMYQGRFKSFPVETDDYFYQVMRYTERNALRANLVAKAEDWQWGSLWIRQFGSPEHRAMLSEWPVTRSRKWVEYVNEPASEAELTAIRRSCQRGAPYGSETWVKKTAKKLGRQQLFFNDDDYLAFERIIVETLEKREMRILSYCLMPNHWHFVLCPENDGDLGRFMQRMTITQVTRWQRNYNMVGYGHIYQGRFKSFPVETDDYFYQVMRYTERNALLDDRDLWLAAAGAVNLPSGQSYLLGDANLDSVVDGQDFIEWNSHKFSVTGTWSQGDWNADGVTDGLDFILWNEFKLQGVLTRYAGPDDTPDEREQRDQLDVFATIDIYNHAVSIGSWT